jgi:hypothetical protein
MRRLAIAGLMQRHHSDESREVGRMAYVARATSADLLAPCEGDPRIGTRGIVDVDSVPACRPTGTPSMMSGQPSRAS